VTYRPRGRVPHIFSDEEVAAVVRAVRASTPFAFRAETLATVTVLLAVSGMRVGEALRLDCGDVDWEEAVLKVRNTKFTKGRDVVVSASTLDALAAYRSSRDARGPATTRLFVSLAGTPVIYRNFFRTFHKAVLVAGVGAGRPTSPRAHDLRHSFAVRSLLEWYRAGLDVQALVPRLSTYLGHREPRFTYRYLTATPELLGHAAARLEAKGEVTP
jgi:Site-specific recombinase XerD